MARKYSYWYIITESFDDRYKQYQRLIWKHPKDVNELFTITVANDETQDFETKTLFRLKYICKTRFIEDGNKIPDDVIEYVDRKWYEHGYPVLPNGLMMMI
jgi:hypothetical protein